MSISSFGNNAPSWPTQSGAGSANWQQKQQNFQQLASALQSGNLSQAQSAYASLTANAPQGSTSSSDQNNPFAQLGQALQSGNLQDAQQAFQAMQSQHAGHHHHHGGGQSQGAAGSSGNSSTNVLGTIGSQLDTSA